MVRSIKPAKKAAPSGNLKELIDIRDKETVLLGSVQEHLLKTYQNQNRRIDIIHPSEMAKADWCPRQTFLRIKTGKKPESKFNFQMESIFEQGNVIHKKWQGWLNDMGLLWGTWKCWCDRHHRWEATSARACPTCNTTIGIEYCEVPLSAEEKYLVAGHADGAVVSKKTLIEIKSIGVGTLRHEAPNLLKEYTVETVAGKKIYDSEGMWRAIKRPFMSHLKQGQIYLRIADELKLPFETMTYLYESKATQAFKEFNIKYDSSFTDDLFDYALDIKYAIDNNKSEATVPCLCDEKGPCNKDENTSAEESEPGIQRESTVQEVKRNTRSLRSTTSRETNEGSSQTTRRHNRSIRS